MIEFDVKRRMIEGALAVRERAYAPYSEFLVGAAVLGESGEIYLGANVENASYGLAICAERVAVGTAVAAGERTLLGVAIATCGGAPPCGACRQVLAEFGAEMEVFLVDADSPEKVRATTLDALLPDAFGLEDGTADIR